MQAKVWFAAVLNAMMAIESYFDFIKQYPQSSKADQAKSLYERSIALKDKANNEITTYKINCDELTKEN